MLTDKINDNPKSQKAMISVLLALFILSFFTIFFALALVSERTTHNYAMTENMWLFFLPLPIPLASLVLGIIYKRKGFKTTKNIVAGIIFSILLIIYGSFTFIFRDTYSHDYSYVNRIEAQINFDLPDEGNITTQDWSGGTQTGMQAGVTNYLYASDIIFTDASEISKLNKRISESELWLTYISTPLSGEIPDMYNLPLLDEYDYFLIYNVDLKTYNSIPESSGRYSFIFVAYSSAQGTMKIGEYSFKVLI